MLATNFLSNLGLKENKILVLDFRKWLTEEYPEVVMAEFIKSPLEMQLGIWLMFFQSKNYYILATPNGYAIDFVNYKKDEATLAIALSKIKDQENPYLKQEYKLGFNNQLLVYEKAIIEMLKVLNGGLPF